MALSAEDERVLQEIVDLDGNCLKKSRCLSCPFRSMCLPEFLVPQPPSQEQRKSMALKVLMHSAFLSEDDKLNVVKEYKWQKYQEE